MSKTGSFSFLVVIIFFLLFSVFSVIGAHLILNNPQDKEFSLTAEKFKYSPSTIIVNKGDTVILRIKSLDGLHGFYLDAYNIEKELPGLLTTTITFLANREGKFTFRCSVTCGNFHPYMLGEVKVQPNLLFYAGILSLGLISTSMITGVYLLRPKDQKLPLTN
ncbi:MAG: cupredoxin domain-containing protein [Candidatus Hodarchaeales archaeon]